MKNYHERVRKERDQLDEKVEKLDDFLRNNTFVDIDYEERELLRLQLIAMQHYLSALNRRIIKFWEEHGAPNEKSEG